MGTGTDPAILITLIVIAVLVLIAIIVFKSKAEKQTGSLKNIEEKLDAMEQGEAAETKQPEEAAQTVAETGTVEPETTEESSESEVVEVAAADVETAAEEPAAETVEAEAAEKAVTPEEHDDSLIKNYNTGRSGHSYSKEELEAQIRI